MKELSYHVELSQYDNLDELDSEDANLLEEAIKAAENAYAPYSGFQVGAAVQLENGKIVIGSNQENASYPTGQCAERVALFAASSQYPNEVIETIAIYAKSEKIEIDEVVTPCGGCRQAISEYELKQDEPIRLLLKSANSPIVEVFGIEKLLPFRFKAQGLKLGRS